MPVDEAKLRFSIIYSFDMPEKYSVDEAYPRRKLMRLFRMTEGDEQGGDTGIKEWTKHRKICGVLNLERFKQFLDDTGIVAERCETMGAVGSPAFGVFWSPAISFNDEACEYYKNAYVTPFYEGQAEHTEEDWKVLREYVLENFG